MSEVACPRCAANVKKYLSEVACPRYAAEAVLPKFFHFEISGKVLKKAIPSKVFHFENALDSLLGTWERNLCEKTFIRDRLSLVIA